MPENAIDAPFDSRNPHGTGIKPCAEKLGLDENSNFINTWEWSNSRNLEEVERWKKVKIEDEKSEVPTETHTTCWYFEQHFLSFSLLLACYLCFHIVHSFLL